MKILFATIACSALICLPLMSQTNEERRTKIETHEKKAASPEAIDRKERSVSRLKKEGVPTLSTSAFHQ